MPALVIKLLESPEDMTLVEELQRAVWPGSETDVVPAHIFITAVHNGGLVIGAFVEHQLVGFVFGFPGLESTPDGPRPKHCSHMMGILPGHRDSGVGFALKRAQWQMVRHQGLDHITWTYDPLLSRNAYLNISKLGCGLQHLSPCRIWRNARWTQCRLAIRPLSSGLVDQHPPRPNEAWQTSRHPLKLDHFSKAELQPLYTPLTETPSLPRPPEHFATLEGRLLLAEIPSNFNAIKEADFALARDLALLLA